MGHYCAFPTCPSNRRPAGVKISVFTVPHDPVVREKWRLAIGVNSIRDGARVCVKHFNAEDIITEAKYYDQSGNIIYKARLLKPRLRKNALPLKKVQDSEVDIEISDGSCDQSNYSTDVESSMPVTIDNDVHTALAEQCVDRADHVVNQAPLRKPWLRESALSLNKVQGSEVGVEISVGSCDQSNDSTDIESSMPVTVDHDVDRALAEQCVENADHVLNQAPLCKPWLRESALPLNKVQGSEVCVEISDGSYDQSNDSTDVESSMSVTVDHDVHRALAEQCVDNADHSINEDLNEATTIEISGGPDPNARINVEPIEIKEEVADEDPEDLNEATTMEISEGPGPNAWINAMPIQIKEEVANEDPEIVLSNKGGLKLIHKGFMYTLHKKQPSSIRWRCVLRTQQCRGSLITNLEFKDTFMRMCHSHPPDFHAAEMCRRKYKASGEPLNEYLGPSELIVESIPRGIPKQNPPMEFEPNTALTCINDDVVGDVDTSQPISIRKIVLSPGTATTTSAYTDDSDADDVDSSFIGATEDTSEEMTSEMMSELAKREHEQAQASRAIRLATQQLVRQMRNIAPTGSSQQGLQKHQQRLQLQQQMQQNQKQTKTLVLKTIPLKVKQVSSNNSMKMPSRPISNQQSLSALSQPPTEVCLRWNSYHSNMQHSFPSLLDSEEFVDVTLACEGRSLKCHKMILSSCSDYLAQLLRENPCQHPIILMKDLKFWEVEALVRFMYRGEVNVTHDKLPQLLNAAEALQVKGLAGPSNAPPKPPQLVPQSRNITPQPAPSRPTPTASKEVPPSSLGGQSILKRGQKRPISTSDVPDARPLMKIRLQRPVSPQTSSEPVVKTEPIDPPLSPGDTIYHHRLVPDHADEDEDSLGPSNVENSLALYEDDDPGGNTTELANASEQDQDEMKDSFNDDHMEVVPTDFLDQVQNIDEGPSDRNSSIVAQSSEPISKLSTSNEVAKDEEPRKQTQQRQSTPPRQRQSTSPQQKEQQQQKQQKEQEPEIEPSNHNADKRIMQTPTRRRRRGLGIRGGRGGRRNLTNGNIISSPNFIEEVPDEDLDQSVQELMDESVDENHISKETTNDDVPITDLSSDTQSPFEGFTIEDIERAVRFIREDENDCERSGEENDSD